MKPKLACCLLMFSLCSATYRAHAFDVAYILNPGNSGDRPILDYADNNIFKATFGGSFGSISLGNVAQIGLDESFVANDLTVVGSLASGGDLGNVDGVYSGANWDRAAGVGVDKFPLKGSFI